MKKESIIAMAYRNGTHLGNVYEHEEGVMFKDHYHYSITGFDFPGLILARTLDDLVRKLSEYQITIGTVTKGN